MDVVREMERIPGIRRAVTDDVAAVAALWIRARNAAVPMIPAYVHQNKDVFEWIASIVIPRQETWVAEYEHHLIGMISLDQEWIDQLYVDPEWTGHGVGALLIAWAKERSPGVFNYGPSNRTLGARRFYERHGFIAMERTDGRRNEEGFRDMRYQWSSRS